MGDNKISLFFRNSARRFGVKRWWMGSVGAGAGFGINMTDYKFGDAIFLGIIKKILEGLQNTDYRQPTDTKISPEKQLLFTSYKFLLENQIEQIFLRLLTNGVVYFKINHTQRTIDLTDNANEANAQITSTTFRLQQRGDYDVIKSQLEHIDNIMNAVSTSVKRLGVLTIMSPKDAAGMPMLLNEAQIKEFEQDVAKDYGILEGQSPIKVMRRGFDVQTISLLGANLKTNENLQTAVKIVCDVLEVPYEVVSAAIIGNPNQTGVYQQEAMIRLYKTVEKYVNLFVKFAEKELNLKVDYLILTKPETSLLTEWEAKAKIIDTLNTAVSAGLMSIDDAKELVKSYITFEQHS